MKFSDESSNTIPKSTDEIYHTADGTRYEIETDLRCSNKECNGASPSSPNSKNRKRLFAASVRLEEDVKRHILKDNPHGEQVNPIFSTLTYITN